MPPHPALDQRAYRVCPSAIEYRWAYSPVPALSPQDAVTAIEQAVPPRPLSRAEQERIVDPMAAVQPTNEVVGYTRGLRNVGGSR